MKRLLIVFLLLALVPSIDAQEWPTAEWPTSTPAAQGMDAARLEAMVDYINDEELAIDSVLVVRHGYLVSEHYFGTYGVRTRHPLYSVAKSLVSTLIGIAIEQGYIDGVEVRLLDIFADREVANNSDRKAAITLEDLLTMTAGFGCYDDDNTTVEDMQRSDDWVQFMLDRPMSHVPGVHFNYCNGVSHLLSAIITETTGQNAMSFARTELFEPLGITRVLWADDPDGNNTGGWGLAMTSRDLARLGYLFLQEGEWDGQQIVSAEWVAASYRGYANNDYGYQWWRQSGGHMAIGARGQYLMVLPDVDMVVVITSSLDNGAFDYPPLLLRQFIVPAVVE